MKKLHWNLNENSYNFIQENAFESLVSKMSAILCQPQCINDTPGSVLQGKDYRSWLITPALVQPVHGHTTGMSDHNPKA